MKVNITKMDYTRINLKLNMCYFARITFILTISKYIIVWAFNSSLRASSVCLQDKLYVKYIVKTVGTEVDCTGTLDGWKLTFGCSRWIVYKWKIAFGFPGLLTTERSICSFMENIGSSVWLPETRFITEKHESKLFYDAIRPKHMCLLRTSLKISSHTFSKAVRVRKC